MVEDLKKPSILIIVLNYNGFEDTKRCVESLERISCQTNKIIIIDNFSADNSVKQLERAFPNIQVLKSKKNLGYAGGMNIGIAYGLSNGFDYFLLLNNDTIVSEKFLEPLLKIFVQFPEAGIASPKVGYIDERDKIYCAGGKISFLKCTGVSLFQGKEFMRYANDVLETSLAEGSCMLIKKETIEKIGLLDEKFFMYLEDVEFAMRVRKHFKIYFTPHSIIYHKSGAGKSWEEHSSLYNYYYTRNKILCFSKSNVFYRSYVVCFSLFIVLFKSAILLKSMLSSKNKKPIRQFLNKVKPLFQGFFDGLQNSEGIV